MAGQIVAIPTETVYGLAADAQNVDAVARIYAAKGRPDFNPLIVHVRDQKAAEKLGVFNATAQALAEAFWPGPLTLVLPLQPDAPIVRAVTAGLPTIAIRCPAHPVMQFQHRLDLRVNHTAAQRFHKPAGGPVLRLRFVMGYPFVSDGQVFRVDGPGARSGPHVFLDADTPGFGADTGTKTLLVLAHEGVDAVCA
ncbi:MAG: L-threonylcarbamoyladenylate synthase, partial [Sphingomonadales bacterium]|nr:L-threonylcarbamoyladenylate synthase [Sphingomonadales bacterium]